MGVLCLDGADGEEEERVSETAILKRVMLRLSSLGATVFRQNTGLGWVGESRRFTYPETVRVMPGDVLIRHARPLHAGLCVGSSDCIGWKTETIGDRRVAVFVAIETKTNDGRVSKEQENFLRCVREAGGIAIVARSAEDVDRVGLNPADAQPTQTHAGPK